MPNHEPKPKQRPSKAANHPVVVQAGRFHINLLHEVTSLRKQCTGAPGTTQVFMKQAGALRLAHIRKDS